MRRGRRKLANKDKVFGCDLLEHLAATNQEIPHVLRSCSEFIEEHGIVDGIYRLSGVSSNTQKLRTEFDTEGTPDLNKDVYLQDIHCVSSLCKAYFRELPNPLLTYQLYDHFAEAVGVQGEEERLVKIRDVLKELPPLHYKTLEYLMRHLVKMATYSNQTNMHVRNLAIVWAPNLLRSKDIESTGFNGTAAFMEVRIQSIVVEFILTHVAQLFPDLSDEPGLSLERRKSLPSPSALTGHDEPFFKALPFQYPGNMSPGDGPPQMRPYHAIIDGTDKRKGSLKGRKWRSIFNLGGRLQDPRKKNKYTTKEKEKTSLRPAKSMDSLSSGAYPLEENRHGTHLSPLVNTPGTPESGTSGSGVVPSTYAVTYRRTGGASVSMVSGGSGTQGTYKSLEAGGTAGADRSPSISHGTAGKAERPVGVHISGPFSVTVPLHITSGLALGVLHGRTREEQGGSEEEQPKKVKQESVGEKEQPAVGDKEHTDPKTGGNQEDDAKAEAEAEAGVEAEAEAEMDNNESSPSEGQEKDKIQDIPEVRVGPEEREESPSEEEGYLSEEEELSNAQHAPDRPSLSEDMAESDYMVMKPAGAVGQSEVMPSFLCTEEEYPDQELTLDFQDTFGFLDLMDTSISNPINEFSVEPPGFEEEEDEEEEEEEEEEQACKDNKPKQPSPCPSWSQLNKDELPMLSTNFSPHRPLPGKSHSLPYKSQPFMPAPSSSSDEDDYSEPDDDEDEESDKGEYEDMFCKSLPSARHFHGLNWSRPENDTLNSTDCNVDAHHNNQSESECLPQTNISQDLLPVKQSGSPTDSGMSPSNGTDNLSPLPLDSLEHLSVEEMTEDKSSKDVKEECGSEEAESLLKEDKEDKNKEVERTDNSDDTCRSQSELSMLLQCGKQQPRQIQNEGSAEVQEEHQSQEQKPSMDHEDEEDTYFGPEQTSTSLEPGSIETSHTVDQLPVKEEPASSDGEQAGSEAGSTSCLDATEMTSVEDPDPLTEQELTLQNDDQVQVDSKELDVEQIETGEVVEEGKKREEIEEMSAGIVVEEVSEKVEEGEEEPTLINEKVDEKDNQEPEEEAKLDVPEVTLEKEPEWVGGDDNQTILERNEEGVEKLPVRKGKEGSDRGEESDAQIEKDELQEETEARKESHLEGLAEIKEGSVPEESMARELSEGEDRLSEENCNSLESVGSMGSVGSVGSTESVESSSGVQLELQQSKGKNEQGNKGTNAPEQSRSSGEKPVRPPRKKEIEGSLGQGIGRAVVVTKQAPTRVYQVKAVPVVPPKPQHSKITAFKQQFQQKDADRQHPDRKLPSEDTVRHQQQGLTKEPGAVERVDSRQNHDHQSPEQGNNIEELKVEVDSKAFQDTPKLEDTSSGEMFLSLGSELRKGEDEDDRKERRGTWDGASRRLDREGQVLDKETKRASGYSMCFDEAVARATGKRCREKEERHVDLQWDRGDQKDHSGSLPRKKKEEEGKTD